MSENEEIKAFGDVIDKTIVKVKCNKCQEEEIEIEKFCLDMVGAITCDKCYEESIDKSKIDYREKNKQYFKQLIPPIYHDFDLSKYPESSKDPLGRVIYWKFNSRGLYLMGDTRKGKTRALTELIRKLIVEQGIRDIKIFWAGELKDKIVECGNEKQRLYFKDEVKGAKLLVFDDVFNDAITESLSSFIFSVIDYRMNNLMPTIITSNMRGDDLKNMDSRSENQHRANALYKRIKESCEVVWFK